MKGQTIQLRILAIANGLNDNFHNLILSFNPPTYKLIRSGVLVGYNRVIIHQDTGGRDE